MTTCTVIVNDALRLLNLNNGLLPADPRNQATTFNALVDLLKMLRGDGLYIVRQFPAAITADLREPFWATAGLKEMLAKYAAPYLRAKVPALGSEGERILRNKARRPISCAFPETLPMGSGNYSAWWPEWYCGDDGLVYEYFADANTGESATFYADFDPDATIRGTSVSSVAWSVIGGTAAISGEALASNLASAQLAFSASDAVSVRARATYANGQIHDYLFNVTVR